MIRFPIRVVSRLRLALGRGDRMEGRGGWDHDDVAHLPYRFLLPSTKPTQNPSQAQHTQSPLKTLDQYG